MKQLLLAGLFFLNVKLSAQDSIPNPTAFAKEIGDYIIKNDVKDLKNQILTWEEVKPVYYNILATSRKKDSASLKEEITKDINKVNRNCDSLMVAIRRKGIDLTNFTVKNGKFEVSHSDEFPENCFIADGRLHLQSGDTTIRIKYTFLYLGKKWKLVELNNNFSIYYKGEYLSSSNFDKEESWAAVESAPMPATEVAADTIVQNRGYYQHDTMPAIPHFADPEVQKYVEEYVMFIKLSSELGKSAEKEQEYVKKAQELSDKYPKIAEKLSSLSNEETKQLVDFLQALTKYFYTEVDNKIKEEDKDPNKNAPAIIQ